MTTLKNDLFLRALLKQPVPRTPMWIMRQAGRYLPEYRATREQAGDFMSLCRNPELACEVTLQPLRRYALDAAILFSDILTVPDAMGLGLYFVTGEGPKFRSPVQTADAIRALRVPDVEKELGYVFDAVRTIRRELNGEVPLIGFAGSPFTCGTYMVEGGSSREFPTIKKLAKEAPEVLDQLMDTVAETTIEYLNAQIDAGAQAVQVFDTWGAALEPDDFRRFSLASMQKIVDGLTRENRCWPTWPRPAAMRSAWTGRQASTRRANTRRTRSRCRATSIPPRYARVPKSSARAWRRRWPVTARDRDTYSTSVTALPRISIPTTSRRSSRPSTS
jgi:uroporphyrinogen decarboxylase